MGECVTKIMGMLPSDDDNDEYIPEIQEQCNGDICNTREISEDDFEGSVESDDEPDVKEETYKDIFNTREDNSEVRDENKNEVQVV